MDETITLLDNFGKEHEFILLDAFGLDEDEYAVLIPKNDIDGSTYIFKIIRNEDELVFASIDDDKELEEATDAYDEIKRKNHK